MGVRDSGPDWAMGVPLFVHDMPQGVIAPVASRIKGAVRERLAALTLFVATPAERDRVSRAAVPGQRIVLFEVEVEQRTQPKMVNRGGVTSINDIVNLMTRRRLLP